MGLKDEIKDQVLACYWKPQDGGWPPKAAIIEDKYLVLTYDPYDGNWQLDIYDLDKLILNYFNSFFDFAESYLPEDLFFDITREAIWKALTKSKLTQEECENEIED